MILDVGGVTFSYKSRKILNDLSFTVNQGEVLALLGPNGVGKTTLIKCINRILSPASGSVFVDGTEVSLMNRNETAKNLGYVAQRGDTSRTTVLTAFSGRRPI